MEKTDLQKKRDCLDFLYHIKYNLAEISHDDFNNGVDETIGYILNSPVVYNNFPFPSAPLETPKVVPVGDASKLITLTCNNSSGDATLIKNDNTTSTTRTLTDFVDDLHSQLKVTSEKNVK
jgi:hypothetical protein